MREIRIRFRDYDDYDFCREVLELGMKAGGTLSQTFGFICVCQEAYLELLKYEDVKVSQDPVTEATIRRDNFRCQNLKCGVRRDLQRHSVLAKHSKCTSPDQCITLCMECHRRVHAELAEIKLISPGKIVYRLKEAK